ncbi:MAG: hypothetical protein Q9170_006094 [Blastenia crenularia]
MNAWITLQDDLKVFTMTFALPKGFERTLWSIVSVDDGNDLKVSDSHTLIEPCTHRQSGPLKPSCLDISFHQLRSILITNPHLQHLFLSAILLPLIKPTYKVTINFTPAFRISLTCTNLSPGNCCHFPRISYLIGAETATFQHLTGFDIAAIWQPRIQMIDQQPQGARGSGRVRESRPGSGNCRWEAENGIDVDMVTGFRILR